MEKKFNEMINKKFTILSIFSDYEHKDEWYEMSLGMFKSITYMFYKHHEKYCNLSHISFFIINSDDEKLCEFIEKDIVAKNYSSTFYNSGGSKKTLASILNILRNSIVNFVPKKEDLEPEFIEKTFY